MKYENLNEKDKYIWDRISYREGIDFPKQSDAIKWLRIQDHNKEVKRTKDNRELANNLVDSFFRKEYEYLYNFLMKNKNISIETGAYSRHGRYPRRNTIVLIDHKMSKDKCIKRFIKIQNYEHLYIQIIKDNFYIKRYNRNL